MNEEQRVPHYKTIAAVTFMVLAAFFAVTLWVLMEGDDPTIKGTVIGTWTTAAITAVNFWLGSSSGGKAKP